MSVLILGGGVSGLATAWFLRRWLPHNIAITLLESSSRIGGWVHTRHQDDFLFELGPRTLRPVGQPGAATLDLVFRLGLQKELLTAPKTASISKNRYLLHNGELQKLPSSLSSLLLSGSPLTKGLAATAMKEMMKSKRPSSMKDETIHDFFKRRFSPDVAVHFGSAIVRGIFAGDSTALSMRSCFPTFWQTEAQHQSIVRSILQNKMVTLPSPSFTDYSQESKEFVETIQSSASIYSFKTGMQVLTDSLLQDLKTSKNVDIRLNAKCNQILFKEGKAIVKLNEKSVETDHLISALPPAQIQPLLPNPIHFPSNLTQTVDVAVVNVAFTNTKLSVDGFGFLVPASESQANILGVVFDSCAFPQQDLSQKPPFTKLTVMINANTVRNQSSQEEQHQSLLKIALDSIQKYLSISTKPTSYVISIHKQCIPQYQLGHMESLQNFHSSVLKTENTPISFVGSGYFGVGVNDCIHSARLLSQDLVTYGFGRNAKRKITGLERSLTI